MKLCSVCKRSDFLCSVCNARVESGQISRTEVGVARAIHKLGLGCDYIQCFDLGKKIVIVADKKSAGTLIGRAGRNAKRLKDYLHKDVKIVERIADEKKQIEKITGAQVLGINKVYGPKEVYKVKLEKKFEGRVSDAKEIVSLLLGKEVRFVFE